MSTSLEPDTGHAAALCTQRSHGNPYTWPNPHRHLDGQTYSRCDHRVDVTIDRLGAVTFTITCLAAPGADCRRWCEQGCPAPDTDGHDKHRLTDQGRCRAADWFTDSTLISELYDGPDGAALHSGPIDVIWTVDGPLWRYPAPEHQQ